MKTIELDVSRDGVLTLPEALRQSLGLENGGRLIAREEDGRIVLDTTASRVARARAILHRYIPPGTKVVDDFIAERRAEAARE